MSKKTKKTTTKTTSSSSGVLSSKKANGLWDAKFKNEDGTTKTVVSNSEFKDLLCEYLQELKCDDFEDGGFNKDKETRKLFAKLMAEQIFWPEDEELKDGSFASTVNKACIQAAIDTWGPFTSMFQTIHLNLENSSPTPLQYFHGRASIDVIEGKLKTVGDYLLRYDLDKKGLILSWVKKGKKSPIVIKHEKITRFKPKGKAVVWRWLEKVPGLGGAKTVNRDFKDIHAILDVFKKQHKLKDPVMFNSAYSCFGARAKTEKEKQVQLTVNSLVGDIADQIIDD